MIIRDIPLKPILIGNTSRGLTQTQLAQRRKFVEVVDGYTQGDAFETIATNELRRALNEELASLPAKSAQVLWLRARGAKHAEIADNLGISGRQSKRLERSALAILSNRKCNGLKGFIERQRHQNPS